MTDNNGTQDTSVQQEEAALETAAEETVESLKEKLSAAEAARQKAEEIATNQKIRAEKAEGKVKETKPNQTVVEKPSDLPQKDLIALVRANIHDDDIDTVKKFAALDGISVADALKSDDLKAVLDRRAANRKSAEVANTTASRRTTAKVDGKTLVDKLSKGDVPEPGSTEAEALFWERRGGKR